MIQHIPFDRTHRTASNDVSFRAITRWETNHHEKYYFLLFVPVMMNYLFYLLWLVFTLMWYLNIPFNETRWAVPGTQHCIVDTCGWAIYFEKNLNQSLTFLTLLQSGIRKKMMRWKQILTCMYSFLLLQTNLASISVCAIKLDQLHPFLLSIKIKQMFCCWPWVPVPSSSRNLPLKKHISMRLSTELMLVVVCHLWIQIT